MKRLKVNTTFEDDAEERRSYFSALSYSDRLRHYFKLRNLVNFHGQLDTHKGKILRIYHSHEESQ